MERTQHVPVMMEEILQWMALRPGMTVIDATLGGGGYTKAIFERIGSEGRLIACDQDQKAIDRFREHHADLAEKITIVHSNYSHIRKVLQEQGVMEVDVIVADLGLSSDQMHETDRGFSFAQEGSIDMRMDQRNELDAFTIVNHYSETEIAEIISVYGDERFARRIAHAICAHRPISSGNVLAQRIVDAIPHVARRTMKIHPATKTFQALRIAVNDEYRHLQIFLTEGIEFLRSTGRMGVVSFHSGEDRLVKNTFRVHARGCICADDVPICMCGHVPDVRILTKKPISPTVEEVRQNPRARSARLRVVEKI